MSATVVYEFHPGHGLWSIESPEFPEWTAFGHSMDEVSALAAEGLPFVAGDPGLDIVGLLPFRPLTSSCGDVLVRVFGAGSA